MSGTNVLVLGATGRTGAALLRHRPPGARLYAGARRRGAKTAPVQRGADGVRLIDLDDPSTMRRSLAGIDVVVNAIRLREDIAATALIDLHELIRRASDEDVDLRIVHVGGAGTLHLTGGLRFWQHPCFPAATLPRGIAHAELRDHLETGGCAAPWTYLVPPPDYLPDGPCTGDYKRLAPSDDETPFLTGRISYEDFSLAVADAIGNGWSGTHLIRT